MRRKLPHICNGYLPLRLRAKRPWNETGIRSSDPPTGAMRPKLYDKELHMDSPVPSEAGSLVQENLPYDTLAGGPAGLYRCAEEVARPQLEEIVTRWGAGPS